MLDLVLRNDEHDIERQLRVADMGEAYDTAREWMLPSDGNPPQGIQWTSAVVWDRYTRVQRIDMADIVAHSLSVAA